MSNVGLVKRSDMERITMKVGVGFRKGGFSAPCAGFLETFSGSSRTYRYWWRGV